MRLNLDIKKQFIVKLGSHDLKVQLVPGDDPRLETEAFGYGVFLEKDRLILLREDLPESVLVSTLFHEFIHALESFYMVKVSHRDLNLIADMIANLLIQNFKTGAKK